MPIMIRIKPPIISIRFPNDALNRFPIRIDTRDRKEVMTPIMTLGYQILTFNIARLRPIARASILVATLNITRVNPREGSLE